jgi:hypothetical protein
MFFSPEQDRLCQAQPDQNPEYSRFSVGGRCFEKRGRFDKAADMIITMPPGAKSLSTNPK